MTQGLTRRSFLGIGAMAAAGSMAALTGCAPQQSAPLADTGAAATEGVPAWLGVEPDIAEGDLVSTQDTGLLIIGAGCAGLAAAATAADLGLDFMLCDKNTVVQDTREYFGAVNTR